MVEKTEIRFRLLCYGTGVMFLIQRVSKQLHDYHYRSQLPQPIAKRLVCEKSLKANITQLLGIPSEKGII